MVEEKRPIMKYIRTYETKEKFLTDKDSTSRGFRLKPTLYKYSEAGDHVHLENDDPRKHEGSTYMEITLDSDVEFSFYIGNAPDDTQTTMTCTIDWGDGTVETKTITTDDYGFKLSHNYVAGSYKIELYGVERDYSVVGGDKKSLISHPSSVKRVVLGGGNSYGVGGVVSIGLRAFYKCSLTSINIPESVTSLGERAFSECRALTSIIIPDSVVSIEGYAFSYCSSLTSVYIPESVTSIGDWVFSECSSLTSINIPESVTSLGERAIGGCRALTSIIIPKSVTSIGDYVLVNCSSLSSIYILGNITSIGNSAFGSCTSLTSINIPESVTSIGNSAFGSCTSLTSISIPESVTSIENNAFINCSSLISVYISEGTNTIGMQAFYGCSSLTSISSFNLTAPTLGPVVFPNLPTNGTLHIKPGATGYDAWKSQLPSGWTIVEDL